MPSRTNGRLGALADFRRTAKIFAAIVAATGAMSAASLIASTHAEAKTPGKTYCFLRKCHRVMTLEETRRAVGQRMVVVASHYDDPRRDRFNPSNLTSSGEWFRAGAPDNAASPKLPNGTIILAWNPATKQAAVLRINNAGPYWGNRTLDVSRGAATRLGFGGKGVATLHTRILHAPSPAEATYRKGRRYAAVPGPIGTFASLEQAAAASGRSRGAPVAPDLPAATTTVASLPAASLANRGPVRAPAKASAPVITSSLADTKPASTVAETAAPTTAASATPAEASVPVAATVPARSTAARVASATPRLIRSGPVRGRTVAAAASRDTFVEDDLIARAPRAVRRPITAAGNRAPECQGWVGTCTVTVSSSSGSGSRARVASSSKRQ